MGEVKSSREMLEELSKTQASHPGDFAKLRGFARNIGACTEQEYHTGYTDYREVFHNCLDIINLRQEIEQSDVLSKQTFWIKCYTIATFVLIVATCLIAILR